jgi:hypothetical protein
VGAVAAA